MCQPPDPIDGPRHPGLTDSLTAGLTSLFKTIYVTEKTQMQSVRDQQAALRRSGQAKLADEVTSLRSTAIELRTQSLQTKGMSQADAKQAATCLHDGRQPHGLSAAGDTVYQGLKRTALDSIEISK